MRVCVFDAFNLDNFVNLESNNNNNKLQATTKVRNKQNKNSYCAHKELKKLYGKSLEKETKIIAKLKK